MKGFAQGLLFIWEDHGDIPGTPVMPDQGDIPGTPVMPDQGDIPGIPPKPVTGFIPDTPDIIGQAVIPSPNESPPAQPVPLLFSSMASDIAFIMTNIMRNMALNMSSEASAADGTGLTSAQISTRMARFFFPDVINKYNVSRLYP